MPALSGLLLVVHPSWAARLRSANKPRKLTLGRWLSIGLAEAGKASSEAFAKVQAGSDPSIGKTCKRSKTGKRSKLPKAVEGGVLVRKARALANIWRQEIVDRVA